VNAHPICEKKKGGVVSGLDKAANQGGQVYVTKAATKYQGEGRFFNQNGGAGKGKFKARGGTT